MRASTRTIILAVLIIGVLLLLLLGLRGQAEDPPPNRITVRVGETVEVDVGIKIGFRCDDVKILRAWMETRGKHNWFIVQGVSSGNTWCRVGTDPNLPGYLLAVYVEP